MKIQEAKAELKELAGGRYHAIRYEITEYHTGDIRIDTGVYIQGYDWHTGSTFREALNGMISQVNGILCQKAIEEPQDIDDQPQAAAN